MHTGLYVRVPVVPYAYMMNIPVICIDFAIAFGSRYYVRYFRYKNELNAIRVKHI